MQPNLFGTIKKTIAGEVYVLLDGGNDNYHVVKETEFQSLGVVPLEGTRVQIQGKRLLGAQVLCWKERPLTQAAMILDLVSSGSHI
jgi:hypothetical protein